MWDVLKEYPAARVRLEAIAVKRLEKYKKAPLEKGMYLLQPTVLKADAIKCRYKIQFYCLLVEIYSCLIIMGNPRRTQSQRVSFLPVLFEQNHFF